MSGTAEAFWRFSLAFYARPGIADALLQIQDRDGANVNLVLFALWAGGCRGVRLSRDEIGAARAAIVPIDGEVTQPVRELRRRLKDRPDPDVQALRRRVAALELAAERAVQARLAASLPDRAGEGDRLAAAGANLALAAGASAETERLCDGLAAFLTRG